MPIEYQYQTGLPNTQQENLFEAEGILLGAVFLAPELIHEITLEPCHFSQQRNLLLFQAMKELQNENKPIDIILMAEKLTGNSEDVGISYMNNIITRCPKADNYEHYQTIILNEYKLRMLKRAGFQFLNEPTLE
ncbi:hypothetical protein AA980_03505 [Neobacillus vireti]|nr:hypothetical protein AA980_03505 [Neobacillus vireti]